MKRHVNAFYVPLVNLSFDSGSGLVLFLAVCREYLGYWLFLLREYEVLLIVINSTAGITGRSISIALVCRVDVSGKGQG